MNLPGYFWIWLTIAGFRGLESVIASVLEIGASYTNTQKIFCHTTSANETIPPHGHLLVKPPVINHWFCQATGGRFRSRIQRLEA